MTPVRLELIAQGFAPEAARVALTATPDYDEARTLCRFFSDLVHEITVEEALDEGLLAPPTELFGRSLGEYECGTLIRSPSSSRARASANSSPTRCGCCATFECSWARLFHRL